eukprot:9476804-Pyramimonas_sp.AAC.1
MIDPPLLGEVLLKRPRGAAKSSREHALHDGHHTLRAVVGSGQHLNSGIRGADLGARGVNSGHHTLRAVVSSGQHLNSGIRGANSGVRG